MPRPEVEPVGYLTKRGRKIFQLILAHCQALDLDADIDILELTMLANSFDLYEDAAKKLNDLRSVPDAKNVYGTRGKVSSEYIVMKSEYEKVMKHGPKYGLNPGDRHKIFGGLKKKNKPNPSEGLDDEQPMKIAQ